MREIAEDEGGCGANLGHLRKVGRCAPDHGLGALAPPPRARGAPKGSGIGLGGAGHPKPVSWVMSGAWAGGRGAGSGGLQARVFRSGERILAPMLRD
jgi:hypothetical protein